VHRRGQIAEEDGRDTPLRRLTQPQVSAASRDNKNENLHTTYLAPSQRSGTVVGACARSLKRLTDFDSTVVGIVAQPFQLSGMDGDALRRYVPDLRLGDADGGIAVGR
jgi:hypothetical protein